MILLIDNYDSFSYNLVQLAGSIYPDIKVIRNNEMTAEDVENAPLTLLFLPAPATQNAGICEEVIRKMKGKASILAYALGIRRYARPLGFVVQARRLMHGKQSNIHIANEISIFKGLPPIIKAGRYHSLIAQRESLPVELLVIAEMTREVMGVKHKDYEIYGLQFHPESILTPGGTVIMSNFLKTGGKAYD